MPNRCDFNSADLGGIRPVVRDAADDDICTVYFDASVANPKVVHDDGSGDTVKRITECFISIRKPGSDPFCQLTWHVSTINGDQNYETEDTGMTPIQFRFFDKDRTFLQDVTFDDFYWTCGGQEQDIGLKAGVENNRLRAEDYPKIAFAQAISDWVGRYRHC